MTGGNEQRSPGGPACWAGRYPVLLRCLAGGHEPGRGDIERLAARIWVEARRGTWAGWMGLPDDCDDRRGVLALAGTALFGRAADPHALPPRRDVRRGQ